MPAPRSSRLPKLATLATAVVASAALVVTAGPATLAAADRLITGKDVADRSIGSKDLAPNAVRSTTIRKNAVQGSDILNGTITAEDLHASLKGVIGSAGPAGPAGTAGKDGAAGAPGLATPDGVATWKIHYEANGDTLVTRTSADTVPAGALIEPLAYTIDGDFSSCGGTFPNTFSFSLVPTGQPLLTAATNGSSTVQNAAIAQTVSADPSSLKFTTSCSNGGAPTMPPSPPTALPVPSFDASLTFQWTVRDTTPTRSFN